MKVRMLKTAAGPAGNFSEGREYDLPDPLGRAFVAAGAAVEIRGGFAIAESVAIETAEAPEAPEQAVAPRAKKKRR